MTPTRTRRRRKAVVYGPRFESCGHCTNGWVTVHRVRQQPAAERCWCWKRHQEQASQEPERAA